MLEDVAAERYVNMKATRASEQKLAEFTGEQNINNLFNSHPIVSLHIELMAVSPSTNTAPHTTSTSSDLKQHRIQELHFHLTK